MTTLGSNHCILQEHFVTLFNQNTIFKSSLSLYSTKTAWKNFVSPNHNLSSIFTVFWRARQQGHCEPAASLQLPLRCCSTTVRTRPYGNRRDSTVTVDGRAIHDVTVRQATWQYIEACTCVVPVRYWRLSTSCDSLGDAGAVRHPLSVNQELGGCMYYVGRWVSLVSTWLHVLKPVRTQWAI